MDLSGPLWLLAWATLLGGPVLTLIVSARYAGEDQDLQARRLARRSALIVGGVSLAWSVGLETIWRPVNWLVLVASYLAWCTLVGLLLTLRPRLLGLLVGSITCLSLLPGILVSTIGILALGFIAGDYGEPPARTVKISAGLDCVETNWGMAASDDGHDIHFYRYLPWFPLVRVQVRRIVVNETEPRPGVPAGTHCAGGSVTRGQPIAASRSPMPTKAKPIELSAMP